MRHYRFPRLLPFRPAQCFTQGPRLASEATRRQTFPHRHHHLGASRRGTGTALRFPPPFHLPFADTLIQRSASRANWLFARSAYYVTTYECLGFQPSEPQPTRNAADDSLIGHPLLLAHGWPYLRTTADFPASWFWRLATPSWNWRASLHFPDPAPRNP